MSSTTDASKDQIILYDLPSHHKGSGNLSCFSFNPWKTRLVLNYKHLPYHTQWTEYPDLAPTLSALGLPPNAPGTAFADYSSPAIRLPPGEMAMHSHTIARRLEALYPERPLRFDEAIVQEAEKVVADVAGMLWWDALVYVQDHCLAARSREFFARTRKEVFGASLEELARTKGGEGAWREGGAVEGLVEFVTGKWRREGAEEGPFVLGREVSFADFVVVGVLECFRRTDGGVFERLMGWEGLRELWEACGPWLERDD